VQALGSYAHWEAEYVAAELKRAWRGAPADAYTPRAYTPPPALVNISLGPRSGLFLYDGVPLLSGALAAAVKAITQRWFVALLPIPYPLLRHLPRLRARGEDAPTEAAPAAGNAAAPLAA
jgi:hypothetical protein